MTKALLLIFKLLASSLVSRFPAGLTVLCCVSNFSVWFSYQTLIMIQLLFIASNFWIKYIFYVIVRPTISNSSSMDKILFQRRGLGNKVPLLSASFQSSSVYKLFLTKVWLSPENLSTLFAICLNSVPLNISVTRFILIFCQCSLSWHFFLFN